MGAEGEPLLVRVSLGRKSLRATINELHKQEQSMKEETENTSSSSSSEDPAKDFTILEASELVGKNGGVKTEL